MFQNLTRREFIKTTSMAALALAATSLPLGNEKIFAADNCTVKTRYGTFNGFVDKQGVKTWLGIPYAQPPIGKLRWQAPQPLKPSNKTFDAKKFGFTAMQIIDENEDASKNPQSEDCLTLNIWTRGEKKNLPVMVFIHGGAFLGGGSSDPLYYGSNFAVAQDVVIVTINYRLNVFGFVNFGAIDSSFADSGYLGLKDQVAALQWVKENISAFGGNPDNVTIFGESAGAISCMMLTVIPAAKGLFGKAIPQSANSYMYNTLEYSAEVTKVYMEMGGAKNMRDMMKKSSAELEQLYEKVMRARIKQTVKDYLPTADGKFLPNDPFKALRDGDARGIKMLTGTTADEWRYWFFYFDNFFEVFRDNPKNFSPVMQKYEAQTPQEIYQAWLNGRPDTIETFEDFVEQVDWRVGQELAAEYQSNFGDAYLYLFSEQSPDEKLRSCHGVDLPYTFNVGDDHIVPNPNSNLVKQVQASWAAFAATGNPNNEFIPHWEKYSVGNRQTMELNSKGCGCRKDLNTQNLNALRYVYES
ncbi:MAG: carboxylesterase/lipase family protein [Selenomonadaceae bacterium]|nr:carboxylesterase/lipase family protein [Selenomonadaceae bacterium]